MEIEVIFDGVREMREAFTVHLKPDENMVAETQVSHPMQVRICRDAGEQSDAGVNLRRCR